MLRFLYSIGLPGGGIAPGTPALVMEDAKGG